MVDRSLPLAVFVFIACLGQGVVYEGSPMVVPFKTPVGTDRKQCFQSISPIHQLDASAAALA